MDQKETVLDLLEEFKTTHSQQVFEEFDLTIKTIFKKEEAVHQAAGHPDCMTHKKIHNEFVRSMTSFKYEFFLMKEAITKDYLAIVIKFFNLWINSHEEEDISMGSYLRIEEFISGNS